MRRAKIKSASTNNVYIVNIEKSLKSKKKNENYRRRASISSGGGHTHGSLPMRHRTDFAISDAACRGPPLYSNVANDDDDGLSFLRRAVEMIDYARSRRTRASNRSPINGGPLSRGGLRA